jgi:hypothetical protein
VAGEFPAPIKIGKRDHWVESEIDKYIETKLASANSKGQVMCDRSHLAEQALDARARRAAQRVGLIARKSRWRAGSIDNLGGFMLIEPDGNYPVDGFRYDLTAEYVIDYCAEGEP